MTTGKTIALTLQTFVSKVISLLFSMLTRFVITFLPRSKCLLISWLQLPSEVILEPKKIKSITASTFSPSVCHEVMWLDAVILGFWYRVLSQLFNSPLSPSSRGSLVPLPFLSLEWYLHMWCYNWCHFSLTYFSLIFLNYESMITHLEETWKIQNKVTYSSIIYCNYFK